MKFCRANKNVAGIVIRSHIAKLQKNEGWRSDRWIIYLKLHLKYEESIKTKGV